ncbi:ALI_collapsed_G0028240.mRNA.1.CDS.1 [Saccharomyces cerevisiae]|nr:ALI_collapsed_G0028240.mRNA.1.CDS.1 [Saccharomyces cerevisiae]
MSETSSSRRSASKDAVKSYFAGKYNKVLDSILEAEAAISKSPTVAEDLSGSSSSGNSEMSHPSLTASSATSQGISKKELLQQIAGSLFSTSIERLKTAHSSEVLSTPEYSVNDSYGEQECRECDGVFKCSAHFEGAPEYYDDETESGPALEPMTSNSEKDPFIDVFLDKLISRLVPEKLPEREHFSSKTTIEHDLDTGRVPVFSATTLGSNFKKLSKKMGSIFELQDSIVRLLTWRNPTGTVTSLILFTLICFNPMYLVILPIFRFVYGIVVPGYVRKHPLQRSIYPLKRNHGSSLLYDVCYEGKNEYSYGQQFFSKSFMDTLESRNQEIDEISELDKRTENTGELKQGMKVLINLRDMQNMTSGTLHVIEAINSFLRKSSSFQNEECSTKRFFTEFLLIAFLKILSPFVNWSYVCSIFAWCLLIYMHPRAHPKIISFFKTGTMGKEYKNLKKREHQALIMIFDEQPETKFIEIFEIYKKALLPNDWKFFRYSNRIFDPQDPYRRAQQFPPGVDSLADVIPPTGWSFDPNFEWKIDNDVDRWVVERGLNLPITGEFLFDPMFKRRRLVHRVIKNATPVT